MPGSPHSSSADIHMPSSSALQGLPLKSDAGEKPVREQLKKTTIAGSRPNTAGEDTTMASDQASLQRKRGHEDEEGDSSNNSEPERHVRKKSKDLSGSPRTTAIDNDGPVAAEFHQNGIQTGTSESHNAIQASEMDTASPATPPSGPVNEDICNTLTSPKNKRPHGDAFVQDKKPNIAEPEPNVPTASLTGADELKTADAITNASEDERQTKRQKDITDTTETLSKTSVPQKATEKPAPGLSSTAASPFGTAIVSKSPDIDERQTSSSAFAASGFGALASSASPFAAFSTAKATSPFTASAAKPPPPITGFGTGLGDSSVASPFAAVTGGKTAFAGAKSPGSGFGGLSGGFGSAIGGSPFAVAGASKLSSFGSGSAPPIVGLSSKPAKPFGAQADDEEEDEDGDENGDGEDDPEATKTSSFQGEERKDSRFYEREHETGEEGETTLFAARAKVYQFVKLEDGKKAWRERGNGTFKLNVNRTEDGITARFIMRADKSHRLILNTPFKKELKVGNPAGDKPGSPYVSFLGTLDGKPELQMLQLKIREGPQPELIANELWQTAQDLREEM
ncbi:hypothetical protein EJ05DRAFT_23792 [Pseudovirgaria hyperparasitica]|uniref:RanBD1 domain-containing protein n=1 Tax=Pseudovirgaria hyperparasitica TaxID=470096 RepID=A0A6A6WLL3_9PEZI|nr:uncharacterized protein EJ05DRAFT_23792 [Pseudovirgaria hyperparasitica]KAF2763036.1 hypothetical protein EJ05DRAFT_23792 [Pseudovirgaria hyperparasitica]